MEFGILLRLVGVVNLILLFFFVQSIFMGENPIYVILLKQTLTLAFIQTSTDQFLSNLVPADRDH